jgi:hypothetical protein
MTAMESGMSSEEGKRRDTFLLSGSLQHNLPSNNHHLRLPSSLFFFFVAAGASSEPVLHDEKFIGKGLRWISHQNFSNCYAGFRAMRRAGGGRHCIKVISFLSHLHQSTPYLQTPYSPPPPSLPALSSR